MTQEDKELLLKDLSARLTYKVKVCLYGKETCILTGIDGYEVYLNVDSDSFRIESIKPYLRPMLSMTEEEIEELLNRLPKYWGLEIDKLGDLYFDICDASYPDIELLTDIIDWLNAHHFDFHNLIERGLAIDCTNLNIY